MPRTGRAGKPRNIATDEIRIGVSACLLGEAVRYDGGHKRDPYLTETLGRFATFVPICPEMELGLGVPRETIRLEQHGAGANRLVAPKSGRDLSAAMAGYAASRASEIAAMELDGYVLKRGSPSCGLFRVPVHRGKGRPPARNGRGAFADALARALPDLPMEEEGRLTDPRLREAFVERVFAHRRVRRLFARHWRIGDLVAFHASEKMLLLAHTPSAVPALGRLVAGDGTRPRAGNRLAMAYRQGYLEALARPATPARHTNVLQHMAGHLKKHLDTESRAELAGLIADYRAGLVPLVVPLTLLRHHVRIHGIAWLAAQSYLSPHPKELMLRNHV